MIMNNLEVHNLVILHLKSDSHLAFLSSASAEWLVGSPKKKNVIDDKMKIII